MGFLCPRRTPPSPVVRLIMRLVKASGLCGRRCALFVGDLFASAVPRSGLSCPVALWRARAQSGAGRLPTRSSAVFLSRVRAAFVQRASWPARGTAGCAEDAAGPTIRSGRTRVEARSSADKAAPLAVARPLTEFCQVVAFFSSFRRHAGSPVSRLCVPSSRARGLQLGLVWPTPRKPQSPHTLST